MRILSYVAAIIAIASQAAAQTAPSQATAPAPTSQAAVQTPPSEMLEHWRRATVSLGGSKTTTVKTVTERLDRRFWLRLTNTTVVS